ncbi:hypothetical protein [Bacillus tequilensis]|uniref:hypothetical protein n=1 Tax=Bacillus tequilensis TaxID=227866 RepID=UPI0004656707|nr:hypothetical protein [Bacillus tequilensis]MDR4436326.1 hypothetical protein [Bacillus tequilensis]
MKEKKGNTPVTPVRFTDADKTFMKDIIDHYNNDKGQYPPFDRTSLLRYLIRQEHEKIFS